MFGAHQKIDRKAHEFLHALSESADGFPKIEHVLHFEGRNGPDGIKKKSPARDEPWHWYDPYDEDDSDLLEQINEHYNELTLALKNNDEHRSAFEAAWLAHAIVDGLTPAHHYPFEEKLSELRGGASLESRDSIMRKNVIKGDNPFLTVKNNWQYWGPKGLFSTHGMFELGASAIIMPLKLTHAKPSQSDLAHLKAIGGPIEWFKHSARRIAQLNMYEQFYDHGWNHRLARHIREDLAPEMVKSVCIIWYCALKEAETVKVRAQT